jgi:hypothetical protein
MEEIVGVDGGLDALQPRKVGAPVFLRAVCQLRAAEEALIQRDQMDKMQRRKEGKKEQEREGKATHST